MPLDQISLLAAIALSSTALTTTMLVSWLGARRDTYLLSWCIGLLLISLGVAAYALLAVDYGALTHFAAFALTIAGFSFVYAGAIQYRTRTAPIGAIAILGFGFIAITGLTLLAGLSGISAIFANLAMALLLGLASWQYWQGRAEARWQMVANTVLYNAAAVSFALCAAVLLVQQRWTLSEYPKNWAEDLNTVVVIVCMTGIGAISLMLNQSRSARHHRKQAMTDSLTGLLNRRALFENLSSGQLAPGMAVIMFDIDHFKSINDQWGHAMGDAVLERFARVLTTDLRSDDFAARLGGEEFCVVLRDLTKRSAAAVAEQTRINFEATAIESTRGTARTTVSAGVAISGVDGEPFEAVLRRADDALYAAKSAGRNRVVAPTPRLVA
ncbi:sensor domain-containing diguanylate cyclase [Devosia lacusdianchii]|jgi:diguanylate cyclase (GGDEF)-like protein|uniref:GGDEF domain-containing protein n=1 Tax=Devosia lacusdianchii TaxID=2917991 RepID=UPI001F059A13|nr:GGDEF domain-containing protein [Devosia sp. JXJ CY 41]